jgi:hypothetical protein
VESRSLGWPITRWAYLLVKALGVAEQKLHYRNHIHFYLYIPRPTTTCHTSQLNYQRPKHRTNPRSTFDGLIKIYACSQDENFAKKKKLQSSTVGIPHSTFTYLYTPSTLTSTKISTNMSRKRTRQVASKPKKSHPKKIGAAMTKDHYPKKQKTDNAKKNPPSQTKKSLRSQIQAAQKHINPFSPSDNILLVGEG